MGVHPLRVGRPVSHVLGHLLMHRSFPAVPAPKDFLSHCEGLMACLEDVFLQLCGIPLKVLSLRQIGTPLLVVQCHGKLKVYMASFGTNLVAVGWLFKRVLPEADQFSPLPLRVTTPFLISCAYLIILIPRKQIHLNSYYVVLFKCEISSIHAQPSPQIFFRVQD